MSNQSRNWAASSDRIQVRGLDPPLRQMFFSGLRRHRQAQRGLRTAAVRSDGHSLSAILDKFLSDPTLPLMAADWREARGRNVSWPSEHAVRNVTIASSVPSPSRCVCPTEYQAGHRALRRLACSAGAPGLFRVCSLRTASHVSHTRESSRRCEDDQRALLQFTLTHLYLPTPGQLREGWLRPPPARQSKRALVPCQHLQKDELPRRGEARNSRCRRYCSQRWKRRSQNKQRCHLRYYHTTTQYVQADLAAAQLPCTY